MIEFFKNVISETVLFGSLIAWQVYGYEGGENVFLFFVWICIVAAVLIFSSEKSRQMLRDQKRSSVKRWYFGMRNLVVLAILVWMGMFVTAAAWAIACCLILEARDEKVEKV